MSSAPREDEPVAAETDGVSVAGLMAFASHSGKGVFVWDRKLRLVGINPEAIEILGITSDTFPLGTSYAAVTDALNARARCGDDQGYWPRLPIRDFESARSLVASDPDNFGRLGTDDSAGVEVRRMMVDDRFMLSILTDLSKVQEEFRDAARERIYLKTTLENINDGAMLVDEGSRIIACNRRMFELYGIDPDRFEAGMSARDFVCLHGDLDAIEDPEERERTIVARSAAATGEGYAGGNVALQRRLKNGVVLEVRRTALPRGAGVITVRDATESEALARQRQMFRTVIDNIDEGVTLIEKDGTVAVVNDQMTALYDIDRSKVHLGMHVEAFARASGDLAGLPADEFEREVRSRVAFATTVLPETVSRTRDLRNGRTLHISRTALDDGGAVATYRDVTQETERRRLLEEAKTVAEEASRLKSDFVARVTHELRTPMNGVLGMAALLERSDLSQRQLQLLNVLKRSGQHMVELIDGLLTVATLEADGLSIEPEPMCLSGMAEHCVGMMRPRAEERGLDLVLNVSFTGGSYVRADETRLTQIVLNLLNNAVKFTEEGQVTLHVETTGKSSGIGVVIRVEDTGVGIPEDELDAIFEKFSQIDGQQARADRQDGVGLGLSIARALSEMMNGTLDVQSTLGQGSTFTLSVTFPESEPLPKGLSA